MVPHLSYCRREYAGEVLRLVEPKLKCDVAFHFQPLDFHKADDNGGCIPQPGIILCEYGELKTEANR